VRPDILQTPLEFLKGVGAQKAAALKSALELTNWGELLEYYPYRYFDRTQIRPIVDLNMGDDYVQSGGTLTALYEEGDGRKKRIRGLLVSGVSRLEMTWFGNMSFLLDKLVKGERYIVFGKVSFFGGIPQMTNPEIEPMVTAPTAATNIGGLQPLYSVSERLNRMGINNRSFGKITRALFDKLPPEAVSETLPAGVVREFQLLPRYQALRAIHFPETEAERDAAIARLKFEELLASQLAVAKVRKANRSRAGFVFPRVGEKFNTFYKEYLPFELTGAQKRVVKELRDDVISGHQMNRLVQGDVGSGKTMVAILAMLLALDNGFQACMMAPTEILATQHYEGIKALLEPMHIPVALLTGRIKGKERRDTLKALEAGMLPVLIGTHALIEDKVKFQNLGLAVIDEQHRFGVAQRSRLWAKNHLPPHVLIMTATPIPRTLAMSLYGDLEVSVIDELPPGRKPIQTVHRTDAHRVKVMEFIRSEIDKGRQAYVVYPLIEESEKLDFESLSEGYEQVKTFFPDHKYHIAMVHGRQPADEKERNMQRFVSGDAQILVSTTVIEVGVNVPNASVMLIESAERFGLSQLHQLRGRVGRGADQSFCVLLTGQQISNESRTRMNVMVESTDGFYIAEKDMELRGPGDIYGTRQSGALKFKLANLVEDAELVAICRNVAAAIVEADPTLSLPENQPLHRLLIQQKQQTAWSEIS
jgi:ATP-dependent DNA helicase RecG